MSDILRKSLHLLLKRQTNILSAAYIIMSTVILSQILGLIRDRLLISIFGASNTLGIYNYSYILPDTIFQLTIASALATAFIPVFSEYLAKGQEKEANQMASTLLMIGLFVFMIFASVIIIFAPSIISIFNLGDQFSEEQIHLMANLMRIIVFGQMIFILGSFFTALLQSYNHFFIPGIAAATYNLGIIVSVFLFHEKLGIFAAPIGVVFGAIIFVLFQVPLARRVGFRFSPSREYIWSEGTKKIFHLMWPRTIQVAISQFGTIALAVIIGFLSDPGRMKLLFDLARTLMFAPVSLLGFSIAQAAFPVLAREKNRIEDFKITFLSSFNQILYLILPVSALILILRIPVVRLVYGADKFDWQATLTTGRTLALLAISIFAQALIVLCYRAFYALHNSLTPLLASAIGTGILITLSYVFVVINKLGVESVAAAFTIANIIQLILLFSLLDRKVGGFPRWQLILSLTKFSVATVLTAFALYIPIQLLDEIVIDTTRTVGLIILTGISSLAGLSFYLFLTWLLNIKEAYSYLLLLKRIGDWRSILMKTEEVIDPTRQS